MCKNIFVIETDEISDFTNEKNFKSTHLMCTIKYDVVKGFIPNKAPKEMKRR
jgi:hypothetical protein